MMRAADGSTIEYWLRGTKKPTRVRGTKLGFFAVRISLEHRRTTKGRDAPGFFVDHVPSGVVACGPLCHDDAWLVATYLRTVRARIDSVEPRGMAHQLGADHVAWLRSAGELGDGERMMPFTRWLERRNDTRAQA